jgi:HEPN domain-containing protein
MVKVGSVPVEQGLLNQAVSFYNGGSRCMAETYLTPLVTNSPMAPAIVCFAFAAELYIKLLSVVGTGKAAKGHKLDELFASLPQDLSDEVTKSYGDSNLHAHLEAASSAFVQWRYQHEHETLTINLHHLINFSKACHRLIRVLRPELKVFGENDNAKFFEDV